MNIEVNLIGSLIIFLFYGELKFVLEKWILMLKGDSHIVKIWNITAKGQLISE